MKNKKLISISLFVIVITTLFIPLFSFNISAEDVHEYVSGDVALFNANIVPLVNPDQSVNNQFINFHLVNGDDTFIGFLGGVDSSNIRYLVYYITESKTVKVYDQQNGWIDDKYRLIQFDQNVGDNRFLNVWLDINANYISDLGMLELGQSYGYDIGYNIGYNEGVQRDFGDDLLGSSLSAPARALNNFVLYTTNTGFEITLWGVFSTCVGLGLFIWFMKMFAGG